MFLSSFRRTGEDELVPGGHHRREFRQSENGTPLPAELCALKWKTTATVWEIHPVMRLVVVPAQTSAGQLMR
jgi:hypothetical protein